MVRTKRVRLARPKGTRKASTARLVLTMHPRQLDAIEARARAASMALGAYVQALLDSDAEDLGDVRTAPRTSTRSPFGARALADDAALIGAGMTSIVVALPDVDPCPECGHPEAFHAAPEPAHDTDRISCDVEGCTCSITPERWRAAEGR